MNEETRGLANIYLRNWLCRVSIDTNNGSNEARQCVLLFRPESASTVAVWQQHVACSYCGCPWL